MSPSPTRQGHFFEQRLRVLVPDVAQNVMSSLVNLTLTDLGLSRWGHVGVAVGRGVALHGRRFVCGNIGILLEK